MKVFLGILIGIAAVVVVVILVAGYFGFVPGLSNIFGSNKPVNLGTTYTQQDYNSAVTKSGIQFLNNTDKISLNTSEKTYGPAKAVNIDFTPSEVLALLNDKVHAPNFPVKDWQLRVNTDGTAEVSALIMMDNLNKYSESHGISSESLQQVLDTISKVGIVEKEIPLYIKGDASVTNGQLSFNATSVKIGRLPISANLINDNKSDIINFYNTHENDVPGFSCNNFSLINGNIHFDGTLPSSVQQK